MLLATPLRPSAVILGKLLASLCHLAILIFASLPIVMLCLPLGGVSLYEVLAAYLSLILSVLTFGMISLAASSYFRRTASSLLVSYLLILPMALVGVLCWNAARQIGLVPPVRIVTVLPILGGAIVVSLFTATSRRLLYPPDVGSEGKEVVDLEQESKQAVGLIIQRDQFPDKLFAYGKAQHSHWPTVPIRFTTRKCAARFLPRARSCTRGDQVSMLLAIPLMAACLYMKPEWATLVHLPMWYCSTCLVGPVFSAGSVTSERERETLDLLLTTILTPEQILGAKLFSGLRISVVLTTFLLWPVLLACVMVSFYWTNLPTVLAYLAIVLISCLTTAMVGLFCSVVFRKTSISLMTSYLMIVVLFAMPLALAFFTQTFLPNSPITALVEGISFTSPFAAAFALPIDLQMPGPAVVVVWSQFFAFLVFYAFANCGLLGAMIWLFNTRHGVPAD